MSYYDVDPDNKMKSSRAPDFSRLDNCMAVKPEDLKGVFSHPQTLKTGEFEGHSTLQIGVFSHP